MREAVQVAESVAPAVLWIDEIEKGFAASASDRHGEPRVRLLPHLALREALLGLRRRHRQRRRPGSRRSCCAVGRFDDLFFVDLPNAQERAEILAIHLRKHARDPLQFRPRGARTRLRSASPAPSSSRP